MVRFPFLKTNYPTTEPFISIVIPCYNQGEYIESAITSVLEQTYTRFETIIVEGGSTDNVTKNILKNLKKEKTTIYFRKERHMVGDNRNYGIQRSRGKYICCLDADDKLNRSYLEKAIYILENQNYDIVSSGFVCFGDQDSILIQKQKPTLSDMLFGNHVTTTAVFKKQLFERNGGFIDRGLGANYVYEDYDLWFRYISKGARVYNIQEPLMYYRRTSKGSLTTQEGLMPLKEQIRAITYINKVNVNKFSILKSYINNTLKYWALNGLHNFMPTDGKHYDIMLIIDNSNVSQIKRLNEIIMRYKAMGLSLIIIIPTQAYLNKEYGASIDYKEANVYILNTILEDIFFWLGFLKYQVRIHSIESIIYSNREISPHNFFITKFHKFILDTLWQK